jgi:hypothetical protein
MKSGLYMKINGMIYEMEGYYQTVTYCPFISVTDAELKRLKEAFKRVSTLNGCITKQSFIKDVLGEGVPTPVAEVSLNFVLPVCSFI